MEGITILSHNQIDMARHALGLKDHNKKSYRNRFTVHKGPQAYSEWVNMCAQGLAEEHQWDGTMRLFTLTRKGADRVLEDGETLCPEDFPTTEARGEKHD